MLFLTIIRKKKAPFRRYDGRRECSIRLDRVQANRVDKDKKSKSNSLIINDRNVTKRAKMIINMPVGTVKVRK